MLTPARPPTIPDLPVSDTSAHHQREVIALYCGRTLLEDAALILPPKPCIHGHYHRPALQLLRQLTATGHLVVIMEVVVLLGVGGLALEGTRVVDAAKVGVILIRRDTVVLEVVVDVLW